MNNINHNKTIYKKKVENKRKKMMKKRKNEKIQGRIAQYHGGKSHLHGTGSPLQKEKKIYKAGQGWRMRWR